MEAEAAIREIVDRETRAWDMGDVELLLRHIVRSRESMVARQVQIGAAGARFGS